MISSKEAIVWIMKNRKMIFLFGRFSVIRAVNMKVLISIMNHMVKGSEHSSDTDARIISVREIILL